MMENIITRDSSDDDVARHVRDIVTMLNDALTVAHEKRLRVELTLDEIPRRMGSMESQLLVRVFIARPL